MHTSESTIGVRPARGVRLIENGGRVVAYPEPHRTPVLPRGWAPLSRDQQEAVLNACDGAADCLVFRLGSVWEPGCEYRVYRLTSELWAGLSIAAKATPPEAGQTAANRRLLGLAWESLNAVRIAVDFFNWDLEARGQPWRLSVNAPDIEHS